jgi:hypothetical protein
MARLKRLGHHPQAGQVDQQVERQHGGQEEDQGHVEDPAPDFAHLGDAVPDRLLASGVELGLDLLHRRDLDGPVLRTLGPVVDRTLHIAADLGPLLGELVALMADERRDEQPDDHDEQDDAEVGQRRAQHPRDAPAM